MPDFGVARFSFFAVLWLDVRSSRLIFDIYYVLFRCPQYAILKFVFATVARRVFSFNQINHCVIAFLLGRFEIMSVANPKVYEDKWQSLNSH